MWFFRKRESIRPTRKYESDYNENVFRLTPSGFQQIGSRKHQEDAFALVGMKDSETIGENGFMAVVADGMGGLELGELASNVAVNTFLREHLPVEAGEPVPKRLRRALRAANTAVYDSALQEDVVRDLGTTLVAAIIHEEELYWISAGDSRIYHYRHGSLRQLSTDHIYRNQLIKKVQQGVMTMEEVDKNPEGAYLTSYLGLHELQEIAQNDFPVAVMPGDLVLLCSDGLCNSLTDQEIASLIDGNNQITAEMLVNEALAKNNIYQDNITVVILSCLVVNDYKK